MEDKEGSSPSGVTFKGDEAPDSYRLAPRTETQQNPNPSPFLGPTVVVAPPLRLTTVTHPPAVSSVTTPTSISGTGSDSLKKKRGRPRKYGPDGTPSPRASAPTLSPMPISSSIPLVGDYSNWKRGKARSSESGKKSHKFKLESPGPELSYFVGANFTTHAFTVNAGEDVRMKVMSFLQQGPRAICVLSANGTISNVTLRQPTTSGGTLTYEGRFEILSLSGSFMPMDGGTKGRSGGMSISMAGPDGRVVGGGLAGLLVAAGPVQVIMGSFIVAHEAEQKQKKPKIKEPITSSAPSPPPAFTITTVNTKTSATSEAKPQSFHGGSVIKPTTTQTTSTFHTNNNNNPTFQGFGNLNSGPNNEEDSLSLGDESRDTPSQSNCELSS